MKKIYGPYIRKDGRKHVIIKNGSSRRTVSYPKYIMETVLDKIFSVDETTDHIDGDFKNNSTDNLQILTRSQNAKKYFDDHPEARAQTITLVCSYCGRQFDRLVRVHNRAKTKNKNPGVFCSRLCQGKVYH